MRAELPGDAAPFERYTGVLYRALGVSAWTMAERRWADRHVLVHSAEHGVVRAGAAGVTAVALEPLGREEGPLIDLRSKEYVRRAPLPTGHWTVRVVTADAEGRRLAVSHWNKHHKGLMLAALVRDRPRLGGIRSLLTWAAATDIRLEATGPDSLDLLV